MGGVGAVWGTHPAGRSGDGGGEARGVDGGYLGVVRWRRNCLMRYVRIPEETVAGARALVGGLQGGR